MPNRSRKSASGTGLDKPSILPAALQLYFNVLMGERPPEVLRDICVPNVILRHHGKDRAEGIEAVCGLVAFRRDHLIGRHLIEIKRMIDHHDERFGHCLKVDFTVRGVPGGDIACKSQEGLFLLVIGMYYLDEGGRITQMYEHWPDLFRVASSGA